MYGILNIVITVIVMDLLILATDVSEQTLLLSAIAALAATIVVLFFYIKSLHKNSTDMAKEFTQNAMGLRSSIDSLKENVKENTAVMHDVHDRILVSTK